MSDQSRERYRDRRSTRRRTLGQGIGLAAGGFLGAGLTLGATRPAAAQATPAASRDAQAAAIIDVAAGVMAESHPRAVILRVTIDGEELVTAAMGESLTGEPATADMHFRNGAVAISYMATALLILVDQGVVGLDDPLAAWLPDLPQAEIVTPRMLANMTAGYPDYVPNQQFGDAFYADPFRQWTPDELINLGLSTPRLFAPGTNWDYSHTIYVILGQALERITGQPLAELLRESVLDPLGLSATRSGDTAAMPEPVLHAFSSERRAVLGIAPAVPFYEESTYWNPSWTLAAGAIQTTNIFDMTATAEAIGTGSLLSAASHQAQISPDLIGFGELLAGCPNCHTLDLAYSYGLGVVLSQGWVLQNPLFAGCGAVEGYLPSKRIAVAVASTFGEQSFDGRGDYLSGRAHQHIFAEIGAYLAPEETPPFRT